GGTLNFFLSVGGGTLGVTYLTAVEFAPSHQLFDRNVVVVFFLYQFSFLMIKHLIIKLSCSKKSETRNQNVKRLRRKTHKKNGPHHFVKNEFQQKPILMSHKKHGAPPLAENREKRPPPAKQPNQKKILYILKMDIMDLFIESWFSRIASAVTELYLENNRIKGILPQNLVFLNLAAFDLSSNNFQAPFPRWTTYATELHLYQNNFSGSLPPDIHVMMPRLKNIKLFHNSFTGEIPSSLCELTGLETLNLRNNRFSGSFPKCWRPSSEL
ncbi:unnamed protein product, partial [Brassica oleracea var. botrytis]